MDPNYLLAPTPEQQRESLVQCETRPHGGQWLTLILLILLALSDAKADTLADKPAGSGHKPALRIAIADHMLEMLGKEISLLKRGFDYAGFSLILVQLPVERALRSAAAGQVYGDLVHSRADVRAYPSLLSINEPLHSVDYWVWVLAETPCPKTPQQLIQLTTSQLLGFDHVADIPLIASAKRLQVRTITAAMRVLQAGRVDYLLSDKTPMQFYIDSLGLKVKTCFTEPLAHVDYYSHLHSSHRDKLPAIEAGLRRAKAEANAGRP